MKLNLPFGNKTFGSVLTAFGLAMGVCLILGLIYFYIYLPNTTNHGEQIVVPFLLTKDLNEVEKILTPVKLRYEVADSSYSADYPPLTVLQQHPQPGHFVKSNRKIYLTINRMTPPTLPLPDLIAGGAGSVYNAEVVLKSNELKRGKILYQRSPFRDLIIEMRMNGRVISPGTRVPKGTVIDLVVGDGNIKRDFVIPNFVGLTYQNVFRRLGILSLNLGNVKIPEDVDTSAVEPFVLKQFPAAGDSVEIGNPVDLWIGPKGYQLKGDENEDESGQP